MSRVKTTLNTSKSSQAIDILQRHPELGAEYERILRHIQHQTFFDPYAVENEFIGYLYDCITNFNISDKLRDTFYDNLTRLCGNLTLIDRYSNVNQTNIGNDDDSSDEEAYTENFSHVLSDENDTYDNLQSDILDHIDFEYDVTTFHSTTVNTDEYTTDTNDTQNSSN